MSHQENGHPTAPPTFQDSLKRTWTINITVGLADAVLEAVQFDLIPKSLDVTPVIDLLFDIRQLSAVLWECIRKQAEGKSVDRQSFLDSLDSEALKNGWGALVDAIVFFIRSTSPKMAESIMEIIEAEMRFKEAGHAQVVATLKSATTNDLLTGKLDQIASAMQAEIARVLESSASS